MAFDNYNCWNDDGRTRSRYWSIDYLVATTVGTTFYVRLVGTGAEY